LSFDPLAAICGNAFTSAPATAAGLMSALFFAGLAGSLAHCGPMCGPIVLAQSAKSLSRVPAARLCEASRIHAGLSLPYHLGRMATYSTLGLCVALIGDSFSSFSWFRIFSAILLALAATAFLWEAFSVQALTRLPFIARLISKGLEAAGQQSLSGFPLGAILGFIPCGLIYAALAVVAATADPLLGFAGMAAFAAGTIPLLAIIGVTGEMANRHMRMAAKRLRPLIMGLSGCLLLFLAAKSLVV